MTARSPTPLDIVNDPELAVLAALDLLLELSASALLAQYPDLGVDDPDPHRLTRTAAAIVEAAHGLRGLLARYRAALARHYRDIPF